MNDKCYVLIHYYHLESEVLCVMTNEEKANKLADKFNSKLTNEYEGIQVKTFLLDQPNIEYMKLMLPKKE